MANPFQPYSIGGTPPTTAPSSRPDRRHIQYLDAVQQWDRIDAVRGGNDGVKLSPHLAIPQTDYDKKHPDYYRAFVQRGNFVNVAARTENALHSLVFRKDPQVDVPLGFKKRLVNIDGKGTDIISFAKLAVHWNLWYGRLGIFIDYAAKTEGPVTDSLVGYPYLSLYHPRSIINWRPRVRDGQLIIDQVVLMESYEEYEEFGSTSRVQFKVLELDAEGWYQVRIFRQLESGDFGQYGDIITPGRNASRGDQDRLRRIPFVFVGPSGIGHDVERSPMLDLVDLNLSHFLSSAVHEQALWLTSQPTIVLTGVDRDTAASIQVGSPQVITLPENASANYLEMRADGISGSERATAAKFLSMLEMGAQMMSSTPTSPETAAAARIRQHSQTSVLSAIAGSVSIGIQAALELAVQWDRIGDKVNFELNQDFIESTIDPNMLAQVTRAFSGGLIPIEDYAHIMMRGELIKPGRTQEDFIRDLEEKVPFMLGLPDPAVAPSPPPPKRANGAAQEVDKRARKRAGNPTPQ